MVYVLDVVCLDVKSAVLPRFRPFFLGFFLQAMAGKQALALYFSAHWCPPCRGFTPQLAEWYMQELKKGVWESPLFGYPPWIPTDQIGVMSLLRRNVGPYFITTKTYSDIVCHIPNIQHIMIYCN